MFKRKDKQTVEPAIEYEAQLAKRAKVEIFAAWIFAVACFLLAVLSVAALIALLPLKQTVPYLIYLDKNTGVTQVVDVANPGVLTTDETNAKHWVPKYVGTRERYVYSLLQEDFDFIITTTAPELRGEYVGIYDGPQKKDAILRDLVTERIKIISVQLSPSAPNKATVRFIKETFNGTSRTPDKSETFVSDLAWTWEPVGQWTENTLLTNPLGFKVTAYRRTAEVLQQ